MVSYLLLFTPKINYKWVLILVVVDNGLIHQSLLTVLVFILKVLILVVVDNGLVLEHTEYGNAGLNKS